MTKLARDSMPPDTHDSLTDKPELAAGFAVCMSRTCTASLFDHEWSSTRRRRRNADSNGTVQGSPLRRRRTSCEAATSLPTGWVHIPPRSDPKLSEHSLLTDYLSA